MQVDSVFGFSILSISPLSRSSLHICFHSSNFSCPQNIPLFISSSRFFLSFFSFFPFFYLFSSRSALLPKNSCRAFDHNWNQFQQQSLIQSDASVSMQNLCIIVAFGTPGSVFSLLALFLAYTSLPKCDQGAPFEPH